MTDAKEYRARACAIILNDATHNKRAWIRCTDHYAAKKVALDIATELAINYQAEVLRLKDEVASLKTDIEMLRHITVPVVLPNDQATQLLDKKLQEAYAREQRQVTLIGDIHVKIQDILKKLDGPSADTTRRL